MDREPSGRWWVGLEGSLRNLRTLRAEFFARGLEEEAASAPRLLARLVAEQGFVRALERVEGECLVAAWDAVEERLYLARDRMGARSLYWWREGEAWCVGSEPPPVPLDQEGIQRLHALGLLGGQRTPWRGVTKVPAGSWLKVDASGVQVQRYWDVGVAPRGFSGAVNRWAKSLEYGVELAVRLRLEEPTAVLYSGGLYSGAVLSVARARRKDGVLAVTLGTATLPEGMRVDHQKVELLPDQLPSLLYRLGEMSYPLVSPGVPAWMVAGDAARAQGFQNILGGFGGAQLFGDDRPHVLARYAAAAPGIRALAGIFPKERRRTAEVYAQPWARRLCGWRWKVEAEPAQWEEVDALGRECPEQDGAGAMLWMERRLFLPEAVAQVLLQLGMRAPLLDPSLVALVGTLPLGVLRWGPRGLFGGAFGGRVGLPAREPMSVPMGRWLRAEAAGLLAGLEEKLEPWFSPERVREERRRHQEGEDRSQSLWALLVLAAWRAGQEKRHR